jgi:hypothetical protein
MGIGVKLHKWMKKSEKRIVGIHETILRTSYADDTRIRDKSASILLIFFRLNLNMIK